MARKKGKKYNAVLTLIVVLVMFISGYGLEKNGIDDANKYTDKENAFVHFIDVGQGSATLIQKDRTGILIDGGERIYGEYVSEYINACGIQSLTYVVASHPHSDHIGGIIEVLKNYNDCEIIMPELTDINTPTTQVYEDLLDSIINNNLNVTLADFGQKFELDSITMEILGPVEQVKDLNDMSVICKLTVNGSEFMILGDAENQELASVYDVAVQAGFDLECDVIAMGHHGSSTSVYNRFLDAVDAEVAVISCGRGNKYGHPHEEALEYIDNNGMTLYRTDFEDHIVFECTSEGYERVSY